MNNEAQELLKAIDKYISATNHNDYEFTELEQMRVERALIILNKHIDFLVQYETKRKESA